MTEATEATEEAPDVERDEGEVAARGLAHHPQAIPSAVGGRFWILASDLEDEDEESKEDEGELAAGERYRISSL